MASSKLLLLLLALSIGICSCKKNYTCSCKSDADGSITNVSHYELSSSDAKSACSNADNAPDVSCQLSK